MKRDRRNTVRCSRHSVRNRTKRRGGKERGTCTPPNQESFQHLWNGEPRHVDPISHPVTLTPVQEERLKQILAKEAYERSEEGQAEARRRFMATFKFKGE